MSNDLKKKQKNGNEEVTVEQKVFPGSIWNISTSGEPMTSLKLIFSLCSLCITDRIMKALFRF